MLFSSLPFLFYFLPCALGLYFLAPRRLKNAALAGHVPPEEELLAEMEENGGFSLHEGAECGKIS